MKMKTHSFTCVCVYVCVCVKERREAENQIWLNDAAELRAWAESRIHFKVSQALTLGEFLSVCSHEVTVILSSED